MSQEFAMGLIIGGIVGLALTSIYVGTLLLSWMTSIEHKIEFIMASTRPQQPPESYETKEVIENGDVPYKPIPRKNRTMWDGR